MAFFSSLRRVAAVGALLLGLGAIKADAAPTTFSVTNLNDSGPGSLRQAILDANGNSNPADTDLIDIGVTGTINLSTVGDASFGNSAFILSQNVSIEGPGAGLLSVRRDIGSNYRLFLVNTGVTANFSGLTLANGNISSSGVGGAICNLNGTLTVTNSILSGNRASDGGGAIYNISGATTITSSTLTGNSSGSSGGAISNVSGTLSVTSSTLSGNSSGNAGAILNTNGPLTVTSSTLSGNAASNIGGAISHSVGTVTVTNSTLSGNRAGSYSGAIDCNGTLNLENSTLFGNTVTGSGFGSGGGAIDIFGSTNVTISSCTLTGNSAPNVAGGRLGGLWLENGTLTLSNSIVAGNGTQDIQRDGGTLISGGSNLIGNPGNATGFLSSDKVGTSASPLDAGFERDSANGNIPFLKNNGGPAETVALVAGSVAIDSGSTTLTTDQRGTPRDALPDIGAFEFVNPNSAPVLSKIESDPLAFTEDDGQTQVTDTLTVDDDGPTLSGATISITGGFVASEDQLGFTPNDGIIGNFNLGTGVLTLSGTATLAQYQAALRSVVYSNSNTQNPGTSNRIISFQVSEGEPGNKASNTLTRTISITQSNDAPVNSVPGDQTTSEDTPLVFSSAKGNALSMNDADAGTVSLTITLSITNGVFQESNTSIRTLTGTVADLNTALSTLTYVPNSNFFGTSTLSITTNDNGNTGSGSAQSDTDTVSITVSPVNDAPNFTAGADVTVDEDSGAYSATWASNVSAGPANENTQTLAFSVTSNSNPALFSAQPAIASNGTLSFTPVANQSGSATIKVTLADNGGTTNGGSDTSAEATFTITVNPINDVPVAVADNDSTSEDTFVDINVISNDTDADNDNLVVATGSLTNVRGGTASIINGGKGVRFTPSADANSGNTPGGFGFFYKVSDGTSTSANTAEVTITISAVNDAPVVNSVSIAPPEPLTTSLLSVTVVATDAENDAFTLSYQWQRNGDDIAGATSSTLDLGVAGNGDDGDSIRVLVTATETATTDKLASQPNSDSVTVGNKLPSVVSVTPVNETDAVGAKRTFTLSVSDPNSAQDISEMWLLINTQLDWSGGATLVYFPKTGQLYLRRGDDFLPPINIGSAATASDVLDNGALRIVGGDVSLATSGNTLTLTISATVRDGLVGNNTLFGRVQDMAGEIDPTSPAGNFGFKSFGPYTVRPQFKGGANSVPTLSALSPKAAFTTIPVTGTKLQTFVFYAADEDGIGDLDSLWFVAGKQRDWTGNATFVFLPRTRRLYLRSDDGLSFLGGGQIGSAGTIENSQVKVDLAQVQYLIYADGKNVGLRLTLQPKAGLLGQNTIWLRVQDNAGATSTGGDDLGFVQSGTWNVTQQRRTTTVAPSTSGS